MQNLFRRLRFFIASPTHSRTLTILALLIVIAAVPMTVFIAQQQQEVRQRASSCTEVCDEYAQGECTHYAQGDCEQYTYGDCTEWDENDECTNWPVNGCESYAQGDCDEWAQGPCVSSHEECSGGIGCETACGLPEGDPNCYRCTDGSISCYAACSGDGDNDGGGGINCTSACGLPEGDPNCYRCTDGSISCYAACSGDGDNGGGDLVCNPGIEWNLASCTGDCSGCSSGEGKTLAYLCKSDGSGYESNATDIGCSRDCGGSCGGGITCSGGYNPGYDYPACQGCDEGTWTCGSDGNWDWDSVTNPSSNCGGSCGTSSSGCESLSSGQFNYECKSGGCPSGWTQSVNTDCPSGQTCCYDYDWTAPTPTSSPTACWQCKCTYDNYHEASAGVSSPEDCTDAACRSQLGSNWFRRSEAQPAQKNECIGNCTRDCIDGGGDGGPRATATLTPTLTPTVTVTLTPTVTPTTTTTPTNTPTPTSTGGTKLAFDLILSFIGGSRGNTNPVSKEKNLTVCIYGANVNPSGDTNCSKGAKKEGKINFDSTSGNYKNSSFDIGSFTTGSYQVFVTTNKYLRKRIPTIASITSGQTNAVSSATLNIGDINSDNIINVGDYEAYRACYGNKTPTTDACKNADLNDDGKNDTQTDASDLRLLFEAFRNQTGD